MKTAGLFSVIVMLAAAIAAAQDAVQVQSLPTKTSAKIAPLRTAVSPSYTVKRASVTPVIDGKLSEWKDVPAITLDKAEHVRGGDWNGASDSSGTLRMLWDLQGLYFALNVRDNHVTLPNVAKPDWENDCCQIVFDSLLNGPSNSPQDQDMNFWQQGAQFSFDNQDLSFCATRGVRGPQLSQYRVRGSHAESYSVLPDKTIAFTASDGQYTYEWFLPWERLAPVSPSILGRCGFGFTINDKDGAAFKSALAWTPGAIYGLNAASLGEIVFDGAIGAMDAVLELPPEATADGARGPSKWLNITNLAVQDIARLVVSSAKPQHVNATLIIRPSGRSDQIVSTKTSSQWVDSTTSPVVFSWDLSQLPAGSYDVVYQNTLFPDSDRRTSPHFTYRSVRVNPGALAIGSPVHAPPPTVAQPRPAIPNPYRNYPYQRHSDSRFEVHVSFATLSIVLLFVVILAIALVPSHVRRAVFSFGSSAVVLVAAFVLVYLLLARSSSGPRLTAPAAKPVSSVRVADLNDGHGPRAVGGAKDVTTQPAKNGNSAAKNSPAWIDEKPGRYGNSYVTVVTSGPWPTEDDSRQALRTAIKKAIGDYARKSLLDENDDVAPLIAKVETSNLIDLLKSAEHTERVKTSVDSLNSGSPMYKLYARLDFNDQIHTMLENEWHEVQVANRIRYAGAGALGIFFLLGGLYVYLKVGSSSRARDQRELKSAALVAILIAVAGTSFSGWGLLV